MDFFLPLFLYECGSLSETSKILNKRVAVSVGPVLGIQAKTRQDKSKIQSGGMVSKGGTERQYI